MDLYIISPPNIVFLLFITGQSGLCIYQRWMDVHFNIDINPFETDKVRPQEQILK